MVYLFCAVQLSFFLTFSTMNKMVHFTSVTLALALTTISFSAGAQQEEKSEKKQKTYTRKYYKGGEKYRSMESPKYYDRKGRDEDAGENTKTRRREEKYRKIAEGATATEKQATRESREEEVQEDNVANNTSAEKGNASTQGADKYKKARYEEKDGRSRREARRSARREKWESGEGRNNR